MIGYRFEITILLFSIVLGVEISWAQNLNAHGAVRQVQKQDRIVQVELADAVFPLNGTTGSLYQTQEIGGQRRRVTLADIEVKEVQGGIALCEIVQRGDQSSLMGTSVRFDAIKPILRITTNIGNMSVRINGNSYKSDQAGTVTVPLDPGTHQVRAFRPGYEASTRSITLAAGERRRLSLELQPGPSFQARDNGGTLYLPGGPRFDLSGIRGGQYVRGDWYGGGLQDQQPARTISVSGFRISDTEITVAQFRSFVESTGYTTDAERLGKCWTTNNQDQLTARTGATWRDPGFSQSDDHPVVCVSWRDARQFAEWVGGRLPTEAEWEYAARARGRKIRYPWGNNMDGSALNFADQNTSFPWADATSDDGFERTAPVGSYVANGVGLHDMAGNVAEWTQDWYQPDYYAESAQDNPAGPGSGDARVVRGGGWNDALTQCLPTYRRSVDPGLPTDAIGFRIVR